MSSTCSVQPCLYSSLLAGRSLVGFLYHSSHKPHHHKLHSTPSVPATEFKRVTQLLLHSLLLHIRRFYQNFPSLTMSIDSVPSLTDFCLSHIKSWCMINPSFIHLNQSLPLHPNAGILLSSANFDPRNIKGLCSPDFLNLTLLLPISFSYAGLLST